MRFMSASIVAGLAAALCASAASAVVINVDLGWGGAYVGLGAAPDNVANTTWNQLNLPINSGVLNDSTGTATTVKISSDIGGQWASSRPNALMDDYVNTSWYDGAKTFTLTGLAANTSYDLYFYGVGDNPNGTSLFTVGSQTAHPTGGDFTSATIVASDWAKLTASSDGVGTITGTITNFEQTDAQKYAPWNGMQVVGAIPEPTSVALLSLAGLALMRRRRA